MKSQVLDMPFSQDCGVHGSKWWVRSEADVFVLTGSRKAVEQLSFGR
jgi:hypothetical protein